MGFLYNAWYCAAWADELKGDLLGRKILNQPIVLYRTESGEAAAIGGACPHRFAPLALGKRIGDAIECPYHGLAFDQTGACVKNPQGELIPKGCKVPAYPLEERHGAVWIWMGESELADPSQIPDFTEIEERPDRRVVRSNLLVRAHYQMVADNLLDLSHVRYLHPFLTSEPSPHVEFSRSVRQDGNTVWHFSGKSRGRVSGLFALLFNGEVAEDADVDSWFDMRWDAPANLYLDTGAVRSGAARQEGALLPFAHLLTPETESTTHYFWAFGRNRRQDEPHMDEVLRKAIQAAFEEEDEPMIVACYEMMDHNNDLMSLHPVVLPGDSAAIRARRILSGLIKRDTRADGSTALPDMAAEAPR